MNNSYGYREYVNKGVSIEIHEYHDKNLTYIKLFNQDTELGSIETKIAPRYEWSIFNLLTNALCRNKTEHGSQDNELLGDESVAQVHKPI
jgi:hypothetical protein